ncbi:MAG: archaeal flagellar protein FlaG [Thermoplasmata archaeon]|jgi:archaellum component FlaG (FlaF/FlaG flagellin family)|nr:archaeal flagellar protein FlaG [Thermoplasmata archaeon]
MASAAAGETVLFIGTLVAAAAVVGALGAATAHFSTGLQERSRLLAEQMASGIAVVNDPRHVPSAPLTLYVKNTGTRTLDASQFAVLVDGVAAPSTAADATLPPGGLATLTVAAAPLASGDHHAHVVADGVDADLLFTVGP